MYYEGQGTPKNYKKALYWYEKSAKQGLVEAQNNLGQMYYNGEGVTKDYVIAYKWAALAKAHESEPVLALLNILERVMAPSEIAEAQALARKFKPKKEVPINKKTKTPEDMFKLGVMYAEGQGVTKDYKKALYWFEKSAKQGFVKAQNNLGQMYYNGEGVTKDYVIAYKWAALAKAHESEPALALLNILERVMAPSEIAEAQALARKFKPKKEVPRNISSEK